MSQGPDKANLLIVAAGLGIGGAEVVIQRLAEAVDRRRFNLTICCIKVLGPIGEALVAKGLDVVVLAEPGKTGSNYLAFLKLLKLIRARKIDLVHTHTTDALFDAAVCRLLTSRFRLVHTFHFGNYPHRSGSRMWFERIGSRIADRLVAVGAVQCEQLIATYGFSKQAVIKVWNGVSLIPPRGIESFREMVGATNHVLVGVTATMIEQKGLFDFLTVASRFRDQADRVRFVIVGDGHLRPRLDDERRRLGIEESVVFTGWLPNANEIALPAFDIFFQPSLWEAMSIALLEAMAAAKPVVATRVGEAPHIVEDGVDGLLVAPQDVDGMTAALDRLIKDPDFRDCLGKAAFDKVSKRFTVEQMTRSYEEIYLDLLQGRPSKR